MKRASTSEQSCARKSVVNLSQTAEHFSSDSKYFPRLLQKSYLYDLEADREIIAPLHFVAQGFPFPQLAPPECSRFFPFPSIVSLMAPTQTEADGDDMLSDASMRVDRRHRVLIKLLPQAAWRLLIDYLMFDRWFSNATIPYFRPLGYVSVCISEPLPRGDGASTQDKRA